MDYEPVTVKCVYCRREIDGHFPGNKTTIISLGTNVVLAVVGEYNKRKGYIHTRCKTGLDAENSLQEKSA